RCAATARRAPAVRPLKSLSHHYFQPRLSTGSPCPKGPAGTASAALSAATESGKTPTGNPVGRPAAGRWKAGGTSRRREHVQVTAIPGDARPDVRGRAGIGAARARGRRRSYGDGAEQ